MKFQSSPRRLASVAITLLAMAALPALAQTTNESAKLLANDGESRDYFGWSVAISGTTVVVGAVWDDDMGFSSGSAYLFDTVTGQQIAKLVPSDGAEGNEFGFSVAISGTTTIVGAWQDDDNGDRSGSAYLFDTTTGQQIAKLVPSDGAEGDVFGYSVAISGTTVVVGAAGDGDNGDGSGSAYLFDTITGQQIAKLLPSDGAAENQFGISVAICGTTAAVGAVWDEDNGDRSGSAYLFDTTTGQQTAKLLPNDGGASDEFGYSVAISGTTAVVGAWNDNENGVRPGSAYLFDTTTGQQIAKLLANDGSQQDRFGGSVAISGNTVVVGARLDDDYGDRSGSAYLFDTRTGQQMTKILASDGAFGDSLGWAVAISGTSVVVSAPFDNDNGNSSGSAYVFNSALCSADLTGDGTLDFFDVSAFLTAFAASDPIADFNADGAFNFFDVSAFLTAFLAGCS